MQKFKSLITVIKLKISKLKNRTLDRTLNVGITIRSMYQKPGCKNLITVGVGFGHFHSHMSHVKDIFKKNVKKRMQNDFYFVNKKKMGRIQQSKPHVKFALNSLTN